MEGRVHVFEPRVTALHKTVSALSPVMSNKTPTQLSQFPSVCLPDWVKPMTATSSTFQVRRHYRVNDVSFAAYIRNMDFARHTVRA
jgi:hypothetical protein